jgi:hypothetical protein
MKVERDREIERGRERERKRERQTKRNREIFFLTSFSTLVYCLQVKPDPTRVRCSTLGYALGLIGKLIVIMLRVIMLSAKALSNNGLLFSSIIYRAYMSAEQI